MKNKTQGCDIDVLMMIEVDHGALVRSWKVFSRAAHLGFEFEDDTPIIRSRLPHSEIVGQPQLHIQMIPSWIARQRGRK